MEEYRLSQADALYVSRERFVLTGSEQMGFEEGYKRGLEDGRKESNVNK